MKARVAPSLSSSWDVPSSSAAHTLLDSAPSRRPVGTQVAPPLSWEADILGDTPSSPPTLCTSLAGSQTAPLYQSFGNRRVQGASTLTTTRRLMQPSWASGCPLASGQHPLLAVLSAAHSGSKALINVGDFQGIAQIVLLRSLLTGPLSRWF